MNVLLCMLVIFIHVSSSPVTSYQKDSLQYAVVLMLWRYAGFAVQGFFFLGGLRLMLRYKDGIDYRRYYAGRLKKIVLPYILWNIVFYVYFIIRGYAVFSPKSFAINIILGNLVSPFYFVVTIVQFYALVPLWRVIMKKINVRVALLVAALITFLLGQHLPHLIALVLPSYSFKYNDRVLTTYLFYWVLGGYVGMHYEKARDWFENRRKLIVILFVLSMLAEGILSYISFSGISRLPWLEYVHFLYCVGAVLFFFTLFSHFFEHRTVRSRLLAEIDRASYLIYLSHCLVIYIMNDMMWELGITSITLSYFIRTVTVYLMTSAGCLLWYRLKTQAAELAAAHNR